jgi:hypothetical protein
MKESGIGRENGIEALEACMLPFTSSKPRLKRFNLDSQSKSTVVNIATSTATRQSDDWFADDVDGKRYG